MRKTTFWLVLLTIGYLTPIVFMLWVKGFFPGTSIYLGHLLDLVLTAPLLLVVLLSLFLTMNREGQTSPDFSAPRGVLIWLAAAFVLLLFEGHGIHFAANSLASLIDREAGPDALVRLDYFYDEYLGHYMLLTGVSGLLFVLMLFEASRPNARPTGCLDRVVIVVSAVVAGASSALVLLEGQFPWLGFAFLLAVGLTARATRMSRGGFHTRPVSMYLVILSLTTVVVLLAWAWRYGSFVQPGARPFDLVPAVIERVEPLKAPSHTQTVPGQGQCAPRSSSASGR
jgi:hypothetical protein